MDLRIEIETLSLDTPAEKPYDIITQNYINSQKGSIFFINMQLK
jgi:hypothetical protein